MYIISVAGFSKRRDTVVLEPCSSSPISIIFAGVQESDTSAVDASDDSEDTAMVAYATDLS